MSNSNHLLAQVSWSNSPESTTRKLPKMLIEQFIRDFCLPKFHNLVGLSEKCPSLEYIKRVDKDCYALYVLP